MTNKDMMLIKNRQPGTPITILITENLLVRDGIDGHVTILDQENEIGHSFRYSNNQYTNKKNAFEMVSFSYGDIVMVTTHISKEQISEVLDKLILDNVITEEDKQDIILKF